MKMYPKGTGLAAFFDASSLFYHDKELGVVSDPHKMLSRMGVMSGIERNYISLFKPRYPLIYAGNFVQLSWVISCLS